MAPRKGKKRSQLSEQLPSRYVLPRSNNEQHSEQLPIQSFFDEAFFQPDSALEHASKDDEQRATPDSHTGGYNDGDSARPLIKDDTITRSWSSLNEVIPPLRPWPVKAPFVVEPRNDPELRAKRVSSDLLGYNEPDKTRTSWNLYHNRDYLDRRATCDDYVHSQNKVNTTSPQFRYTDSLLPATLVEYKWTSCECGIKNRAFSCDFREKCESCQRPICAHCQFEP